MYLLPTRLFVYFYYKFIFILHLFPLFDLFTLFTLFDLGFDLIHLFIFQLSVD